MARSALRSDSVPAEPRARIEALRAKLRTLDYPRMTDAELAEYKARGLASLASMAIEGIYLEADQVALFAMLEEERVPPELRIAMLHEYCGTKPVSTAG